MKCSEKKPQCAQCIKQGVQCDYSVKLKWDFSTKFQISKIQFVDVDLPKNLSFINTSINQKIDNKEKRTLDDHFEINTTQDTSLVDPELLFSLHDGVSEASEASEEPVEDENGVIEIYNDRGSEAFFMNDDINDISDIFSPSDFTNSSSSSPSFMNFQQGFNSAPKILKSLHQLPDMLLNDQYFYDSFTFFIEKTSKILVVAPESIYEYNPFQKILPMLAVANDSVLCIVLSFAILHQASTLKQEIPKDIINNLQKRGFNSFKKTVNDNEFLQREKYNETDDMILIITLLLASFDIFAADETGQWLLHMREAKKLYKRRALTFEEVCFKIKQHRKNPKLLESDLLFFIYRWLSFVDVFGLMSSPILINDSNSTNNQLLEEIKSDLDFNKISNLMEDDNGIINQNIDHELIQENTAFTIDPLLGFDVRFIPLFANITDLIKETNNYYKFDSSIHSKILLKGIKLEEYLTKVFNSNKEAVDALKTSYDILFSTNKMFYYNALLNLYRRVFLMDRNTPLIQELCFKMKHELDQFIEPGSPAETCSMVCIFTASVESTDPSLREFFNERLTHLINKGNTRVAKTAIQVVHKTWETGANWIDVTNDMMATNLAFI